MRHLPPHRRGLRVRQAPPHAPQAGLLGRHRRIDVFAPPAPWPVRMAAGRPPCPVTNFMYLLSELARRHRLSLADTGADIAQLGRRTTVTAIPLRFRQESGHAASASFYGRSQESIAYELQIRGIRFLQIEECFSTELPTSENTIALAANTNFTADGGPEVNRRMRLHGRKGLLFHPVNDDLCRGPRTILELSPVLKAGRKKSSLTRRWSCGI